MSRTFSIKPRGPFSLERLALFGFGHRHESAFDGTMRLAFCLDEDYTQQVGVAVTQDESGVHCEVEGDGDLATIQRQVERILSLDHDGREFVEICRKDRILDQLQKLAPGLRPPQFYSPYEAAVWSIISARRPAKQMAKVRDEMAKRYGRIFTLAGKEAAALPVPAELLKILEFAGLSAEKIERLHIVAQAAIDGRLSVKHLTAMAPDEAMKELQKIRGIGPFYSALIVIRASGLADVLPESEPRALELIKKLYDLPTVPSSEELNRLADTWKPFRTWAVVLIRAVGPKLS